MLKFFQKTNKNNNPSKKSHNFSYNCLVRPFYLLSITLLSLLLPLSFLLLARLSSAHYLLSLASNPPPKSLLCNLFLDKTPNILHALVCVVSLATFINILTCRINPLNLEFSRSPVFQPRVHAAWIFLCTLQVCVGLGIDATISAGFDSVGFGNNKNVLTKLIFFLGLHETMIHWARTVVRPVVDDTVFGTAQKERRIDMWVMAASFTALSWWRLRDEVESLVVVVEVKSEMMMKVGVGDFISWCLYYLTVAIGMAKIFKGILWIFMVVYRRRVEEDEFYGIELEESDEKV